MTEHSPLTRDGIHLQSSDPVLAEPHRLQDRAAEPEHPGGERGAQTAPETPEVLQLLHALQHSRGESQRGILGCLRWDTLIR